MSSNDHETTRAQLTEYLRLNPNASAVEAVGATGADPSVWVDAVQEAITADRPHTSLPEPAAGLAQCGNDKDAEPSPDSPGEEPAFEDETPGCDTAKPPSGTAEDGQNSKRRFGEWVAC